MGRRANDATRRQEWLHIRLTRAERESLAERADLEEVPVSDLVREGIAAVLAKPAARMMTAGEMPYSEAR